MDASGRSTLILTISGRNLDLFAGNDEEPSVYSGPWKSKTED
jgi:hypothetical protein